MHQCDQESGKPRVNRKMGKLKWYHYLVVRIMIAAAYIGKATELIFLAMLIILPWGGWLFNRLSPEKPASNKSSEHDKL